MKILHELAPFLIVDCKHAYTGGSATVQFPKLRVASPQKLRKIARSLLNISFFVLDGYQVYLIIFNNCSEMNVALFLCQGKSTFLLHSGAEGG